MVYLALSEERFEIFGKRHSNKMTKFMLIVYFHGTKNYQSIFLFLNMSTRGSIGAMREYLKTRSDKSISSNQTIRSSTFMHNHITITCIKDLLHTDRL